MSQPPSLWYFFIVAWTKTAVFTEHAFSKDRAHLFIFSVFVFLTTDLWVIILIVDDKIKLRELKQFAQSDPGGNAVTISKPEIMPTSVHILGNIETTGENGKPQDSWVDTRGIFSGSFLQRQQHLLGIQEMNAYDNMQMEWNKNISDCTSTPCQDLKKNILLNIYYLGEQNLQVCEEVLQFSVSPSEKARLGKVRCCALDQAAGNSRGRPGLDAQGSSLAVLLSHLWRSSCWCSSRALPPTRIEIPKDACLGFNLASSCPSLQLHFLSFSFHFL